MRQRSLVLFPLFFLLFLFNKPMVLFHVSMELKNVFDANFLLNLIRPACVTRTEVTLGFNHISKFHCRHSCWRLGEGSNAAFPVPLLVFKVAVLTDESRASA